MLRQVHDSHGSVGHVLPSMYAVRDKLSTTKKVTKLKKMGPLYSYKVDTVHIIRFIDVSRLFILCLSLSAKGP